MPIPIPTPVLRLIHKDNLHLYLSRGGIHAPNHTPDDGLKYRTIHNAEVQSKRGELRIPCGARGCLHDYVAFYFGCLSPMLLNLKTGRVAEYNEGQEPLIYLVSHAQAIRQSGVTFVFSDGHGIASFTQWFDDLQNLDRVDWKVVNLRYWKDTLEDLDRQRRKQAEFLVHQFCAWSLIQEIVVGNDATKSEVENTLRQYPQEMQRAVRINKAWYYY